MLVNTITEFVEFVNQHIDVDGMDEESSQKLQELSGKVIKEAEDSVTVNAEYVIKKVESFDDLTAKVHDTVEFERGDSMISIPVHSITAAEMAKVSKTMIELEPKKPKPRDKNGVPDENDPHYSKDLAEYLTKHREYVAKINLIIFKFGLDIKIPEGTEAEQLEHVNNLAAGDGDKIVEKIFEISNLNESTVVPFGSPSRRGS